MLEHAALLLAFAIADSGAAPAEAAAHAFLDRFAGRWMGEGTTRGKPIRDEMQFEWTLGRRFLRLRYRALAGDDFQAEGYVWYDPERSRYEFYEFNTGRAPVRVEVGQRTNDRLVFVERTERRHMQLTLELVDTDTLKLTEAEVFGKRVEPYVYLTFRRAPESKAP